jgi:parvulin-like peptidyl-prolyl isomerase
MKKLVSAVVLLVAAVTAWSQVLDRPVAVVRLTETVNIGQRELRQDIQTVEQRTGSSLSEQQKREVLNARINEVLINQAAERANVTVTQQEVQQAIDRQRANVGQNVSQQRFRQLVSEQTGMEWEEYRQQIRQRLIQERYVLQTHREMFDQTEEPSSAEIRDFYERNATEFTNPAMVRFTHIFFDTRQASNSDAQDMRNRAEQMYRRIESGSTSFESLVEQAEDDPSYNAGDFGYIMRQNDRSVQVLGEQFVRSLFQMEESNLSRGVLESNVGFHIVKVTNKRSPRLLQLDDPILPGESMTVRDRIENMLLLDQQQQAFQRAVEQAVNDLRSEASITIHEENLTW